MSKLQTSVQKQIVYLDVELNDSDWKRKLSFQPPKVQIVTWELEGMLTHFVPLISFDTLWKHQKTSGFLMFSRGIKRDQWHEMG